MKKILILTAAFGEGHNSAARGIRQGLLQFAGRDVRVEVHDLFAETYGPANTWAREMYLGLINQWPQTWGRVYRWLDRQQKFEGAFRIFFTLKKYFRQLLATFEPDVIVTVYPAYSHMLDEMLGATERNYGKRVVVITDSLSVNAIWYQCSADYYLLPNDRSAAVLHAAGISPEKTRTFGFPVSPEFTEPAPERPAPTEDASRVLYLVNARKAIAPELVLRLAALRGVSLTVAVGRDRRLRNSIESIRNLAPRPFEIVGWSEELPRLLRASHLLISKAGGATVQEAIAANCPMIVNHIIPGQEEGNARFLVEMDAGAIAIPHTEIVATVESIFANDAARWKKWSANIAQLSRPAASLDTARFLLSL
ncbi:MAG: glycosyltransferase [Chthoniobacterales bacterium]